MPPEGAFDLGPAAESRAGAPCPWCGQEAPRIDVHGHVQCARCGTHVDPCCGGERAISGDR